MNLSQVYCAAVFHPKKVTKYFESIVQKNNRFKNSQTPKEAERKMEMFCIFAIALSSPAVVLVSTTWSAMNGKIWAQITLRVKANPPSS